MINNVSVECSLKLQEEELALTGSILATLYVASDAKDTDFTAKVSDVYPTGEVVTTIPL